MPDVTSTNHQEVTTPESEPESELHAPYVLDAVDPTIGEYIRQLAESAPEMTDDQCARLARLLGFR